MRNVLVVLAVVSVVGFSPILSQEKLGAPKKSGPIAVAVLAVTPYLSCELPYDYGTSSDGKEFWVADKISVLSFDLSTGKQTSSWKGNKDWTELTHLHSRPDILGAATEKTLALHDRKTGKILYQQPREKDDNFIGMSEDGKLLALGHGNELSFRTLPDGKEKYRLKTLAKYGDVKKVIQLHGDGPVLAVHLDLPVGFGGRLVFSYWDPKTEKELKEPLEEPLEASLGATLGGFYLQTILFKSEDRISFKSPLYRRVLSDAVSWGKTPDPIDDIVAVDDFRFVTTHKASKLIRLYDISRGGPLAEYTVPLEGKNPSLFFTGEGKRLGITRLYDPKDTGKCRFAALDFSLPGKDAPKDFKGLWEELGSKDAKVAYKSFLALSEGPEFQKELIGQLAKDAPKSNKEDKAFRAELRAQFDKLDDRVFVVREKAVGALNKQAKDFTSDQWYEFLDEGAKFRFLLEGQRRFSQRVLLSPSLSEKMSRPVVGPERLRTMDALHLISSSWTSYPTLPREGRMSILRVLRAYAEGAPWLPETRLARQWLEFLELMDQ